MNILYTGRNGGIEKLSKLLNGAQPILNRLDYQCGQQRKPCTRSSFRDETDSRGMGADCRAW